MEWGRVRGWGADWAGLGLDRSAHRAAECQPASSNGPAFRPTTSRPARQPPHLQRRGQREAAAVPAAVREAEQAGEQRLAGVGGRLGRQPCLLGQPHALPPRRLLRARRRRLGRRGFRLLGGARLGRRCQGCLGRACCRCFILLPNTLLGLNAGIDLSFKVCTARGGWDGAAR